MNQTAQIHIANSQLDRGTLHRLLKQLGVDGSSPERLIETLPFTGEDATAGSETELQTAVLGRASDVDLPQRILSSHYFHNVKKRADAEEIPAYAVSEIERLISTEQSEAWENSWIRVPLRMLNDKARRTVEVDLRSSRSDPASPRRGDTARFLITDEHERGVLRVPISYLLKLALAQFLGQLQADKPWVMEIGNGLLSHFLDDNSSPETHSFYVSRKVEGQSLGMQVARETSIRFLLSHLLLEYANQTMGLADTGQQAIAYFSPTPPSRLKQLNDCVSDSFFRSLFISPCLSGWDRGEDKHRYMELCHSVLSRSKLNTISTLRDAGIITRNLVVLPNTSSTALANNGIHVTLGSRRLSTALSNTVAGIGKAKEKLIGDLVIKVVEHFLPLFVATYSAAPYRIDFRDFHPETLLGFLPHELHYIHLRMIWRRWKKKARNGFLGHDMTPSGPRWLDDNTAWLFGLGGDVVPDYRLIDYLVALGSTDSSPSLDGALDNHDRLRADLDELGIFDKSMSIYQLYKQRELDRMGFSGFEARHYSLFESLSRDMSSAVDLQLLVTAFAFKLIATGQVTHADIPDTRFVESERRQIFFDSAIGLPTFFVRENTTNGFLQRIVRGSAGTRTSHRYRGYVRVHTEEYRLALLTLLRKEGADLIEHFDMQSTLDELQLRITEPQKHAAGSRLVSGILQHTGARDPFKLSGKAFNQAAEHHYQGELRKQYVREGFDFLLNDLSRQDNSAQKVGMRNRLLHEITDGNDPCIWLLRIRHGLEEKRLPDSQLSKLIELVLITIYADSKDALERINENRDTASAPVHRTGVG